MDCFFHEGIKVLYRVAMAILFLFYKYSSSQSSEWSAELAAQGVDNALTKFCRQMPVSIHVALVSCFSLKLQPLIQICFENLLVLGPKIF